MQDIMCETSKFQLYFKDIIRQNKMQCVTCSINTARVEEYMIPAKEDYHAKYLQQERLTRL